MPNKNLKHFTQYGKNLRNLGKLFKTIWGKMHTAFLSKFLGKSFALDKAPKSQNPKKIDTFTSTTYKILLLYLGTSVCFLGIISFMMYNKELHNLRDHQSMQMRNDFIQIATAMAQRDFKSSAGIEREIKKNTRRNRGKRSKTPKEKYPKKSSKTLKRNPKTPRIAILASYAISTKRANPTKHRTTISQKQGS